ncbi:MAG: hypothetical protein WA210_23005, partial [Burkholderiaceae bacterium]
MSPLVSAGDEANRLIQRLRSTLLCCALPLSLMACASPGSPQQEAAPNEPAASAADGVTLASNDVPDAREREANSLQAEAPVAAQAPEP